MLDDGRTSSSKIIWELYHAHTHMIYCILKDWNLVHDFGYLIYFKIHSPISSGLGSISEQSSNIETTRKHTVVNFK